MTANDDREDIAAEERDDILRDEMRAEEAEYRQQVRDYRGKVLRNGQRDNANAALIGPVGGVVSRV
jgi:hypothetical protein